MVLIALVIAVYTIAVSLLGVHLKTNEMYVKRRLKETKYAIDDLQKSDSDYLEQLTSIEEEIKKAQKVAKKLEDVLYSLTLNGAVMQPLIPFIGTLLLSGVALLFPSITEIVLIVSIIFLVWGGYKMSCTLRAIDFAATNIPLPTFDVTFANDKKSIEIKSDTNQIISIAIGNSGYDLGESIEVSVFIPSSFKVYKDKSYLITIQPNTSASTHPSFIGVYYEIEILHVDTDITFDIKIKSPKVKDTFKIPVYVCERKINQEDFKLELIVK